MKTHAQVVAEMEEEAARHASRPWLLRKAIDARAWARRTWRYPPRPDTKVKFAIQRIRHGYSERDWWSFDWFLAKIIVSACQKFRTEGHGHPADMTWDEWVAVLKKIEDGFQAYLEMENLLPHDAQEELAKFEEGSALFIKHFNSLWD